jgi:uncharacterized protein YecT (DUF1311 family)
MRLSLLLICLLGLAAPALHAQDAAEPHPIDAQLDACMNIPENQSTQGTVGCLEAARTAWDAELNRNYKLLMGALKTPGQEALRTAQRQWIAYRDKETLFSDLMHRNMDGTMFLIFAADRRMQLVRARALELASYYDTLSLGE